MIHRHRKTIEQIQAEELIDETKEFGKYHDLLVVNHYAFMKESIFVGFFLPLILGEKEPEDGVSWVFRWIKAVGSPSVRTKVIHDRTGEELFIVPPILLTQAALSSKQRAPLAEIISEYFLRKNNAPNPAANFMYGHLQDRNEDIDENMDHEIGLNAWRYIIDKYRPKEGSKPASQEEPNSNVEDGFNYDY